MAPQVALLLALTITSCGPSPEKFLNQNKARFEGVVARYQSKVRSGEIPSTQTYAYEAGGRVSVEIGPPLRVLFVESSWGDQKVGVVFDESGEILKVVNEVKVKFGEDYSPNEVITYRKESKIDSIIMLFGGKMTDCEHISGPWYWCKFQ